MSDSADDELNAPPLKKARYQWQVKGSRGHHRQTTNPEDENSKNRTSSCKIKELQPNSGTVPSQESNQDFSNGYECSSQVDETQESTFFENTDIKLLDTVKKFVNGQAQNIVKETLKQNLNDRDPLLIQDGHCQGFVECSEHDESADDQVVYDNGAQSQSEDEISEVNSEGLNINQSPATNNRPIDYITRWQSQQKAKAIVDNAINMTLEEMGLTPNLDHNLPILERLHVEDESISEAIRHRGLYPQDNDGDNLQETISPLLQQLSQVSDTVFADRLNSMRLFITIRQTARNPEDGNEAPLEWTDELAISTIQARSEENNSASANNNSTGNVSATNVTHPDQSFQLSMNSNANPPVPAANQPNNSSVYGSDDNIETNDNVLSEDNDLSDKDCVSNGDEAPHDHSCMTADTAPILNSSSSSAHVLCRNIDENRTTVQVNDVYDNEPSMEESDVMNIAVNAAINAKGLVVKND